MKLRRQILAAILASTAALWVTLAVFAQVDEILEARLTPVPVDLAMLSRIAGSGSLTATLNGNKLTIHGSFSGLHSAATSAHIHRGPKGIRGPAILELIISKAESGSISGSFVLTAEQVKDVRNERFYVQINSERAPEGNLWGWLLR
jgi:hypothetical protein